WDRRWSITDYIDKRAKSQLQFFDNATKRERRTIRNARWLAIVLGLTAVLLSVSGASDQKASGGSLAASMLGVVTTAAAAIAAAFQSGRHHQIALRYQTAERRGCAL